MAAIKPTRFRCRLCRRKVKVVFYMAPVPEALEVCPSCWESKDVPTARLKAAIAKKVRQARAARRRGERGYGRALAMQGRDMLNRLRRAQKHAKKV